jgi:hypothetical protein
MVQHLISAVAYNLGIGSMLQDELEIVGTHCVHENVSPPWIVTFSLHVRQTYANKVRRQKPIELAAAPSRERPSEKNF